MTVTVFFLILTSIDLDDFLLVSVLIKNIIKHPRQVLHRISKHLEVRQNIPLSVVFSTLFSVFGNVVKVADGLPCLIYYLEHARHLIPKYCVFKDTGTLPLSCPVASGEKYHLLLILLGLFYLIPWGVLDLLDCREERQGISSFKQLVNKPNRSLKN